MTTARSKRLAQLLKINDATRDHRCTSCHAPWQNLPGGIVPSDSTAASEAVSCETCHGPAGDYIRSHTRPDFTRSEKMLDGLRDLTVLYNRANTCVACHQALDPQLLEAGHPELLFELGGQTAAMPRHWREKDTNTHAIAWFTGQAAALRELTAQLRNKVDDKVYLQWQAALWVVNTANPTGSTASFDTNAVSSTDKLTALHRVADELALKADSPQGWLQNLLNARIEEPATNLQAARAERLVQGIDRLLYSVPNRATNSQLGIEELFKQIQSRPDFSPSRFNQALQNMRNTAARSAD